MIVGFALVNFNNAAITVRAIESIKAISGGHEILAVVVDNNSEEADRKRLREGLKSIDGVEIIWSPVNVGYFSGLNIALTSRPRFLECDFVVVGNNDLIFPSLFAERLASACTVARKYAVISPNLISSDGVHQNPHVLRRIGRFRRAVWDLYYSSYFFANVIAFFARALGTLAKRKDTDRFQEAGEIFLGYGACYILTREFFKYFRLLWAPTFLMGEEVFLAKQLASRGMKLYYEPRIEVIHEDHATLNQVGSKKLWLIAKKSHSLVKAYIDRDVEGDAVIAAGCWL